jgi:hypothetical protein
MKNRITIYADFLKKNLIKEGYKLIKQRSYPLTGGVLLTFDRNGKEITDRMINVNCQYRLEIKPDTFSVYLFYN